MFPLGLNSLFLEGSNTIVPSSHLLLDAAVAGGSSFISLLRPYLYPNPTVTTRVPLKKPFRGLFVRLTAIASRL